MIVMTVSSLGVSTLPLPSNQPCHTGEIFLSFSHRIASNSGEIQRAILTVGVELYVLSTGSWKLLLRHSITFHNIQ